MKVIRTLKDNDKLMELASLIIANDEILKSKLNNLQKTGDELCEENFSKNKVLYDKIKSILISEGKLKSLDETICFSINDNFIGLPSEIDPNIQAIDINNLPKGLLEALRRALGNGENV